MKSARPPWEGPDAYRILYQLAAQHLNAASDDGYERRAHLQAAARHAAELTQRATAQLSREMERATPWHRRALAPVSLSLRQERVRRERLRTFLEQTVLPCGELLEASVRVLETGDADAVAATGARLSLPPARAFSYRAWYSLACYRARCAEAIREATGESVALEETFDALEHALRLAEGQRRLELGRWAQSDPALRVLARDDRFKPRLDGLLDAYAIPSTDAKS